METSLSDACKKILVGIGAVYCIIMTTAFALLIKSLINMTLQPSDILIIAIMSIGMLWFLIAPIVWFVEKWKYNERAILDMK